MVGIVAIAIAIVMTTSVLAWKFQNSFYFSKTESVKKVEVPKKSQKEAVTSTKENASTNRIYRNEKYGFQMELPNGWEGYRVSESRNETTGVLYVEFTLPTKENPELWNGEANVGAIGVWDRATWDSKKTICAKEASPDCPNEYGTVGSNASYFFDYTPPQDFPESMIGLVVNSDYFQKHTVFFPPTEKGTMGSASDVLNERKTYTNKDFGITLQYPASWIVSDEGFFESGDSKNGKTYHVLFSAEPAEEGVFPGGNADTRIGFQIYPSQKSLDDFSCPPRDEGRTCFSSRRVISGENILTTTFEQGEGEGMGNKEREIYLVKDGNVFQFYSGFNGIPQGDSLSVLAGKSFAIDQVAASIQFFK